MPKCSKCGRDTAGHQKPWGDKCTLTPLPSHVPLSTSESPAPGSSGEEPPRQNPEDITPQVTTEDHNDSNSFHSGESDLEDQELDLQIKEMQLREDILKEEVKAAERKAAREQKKKALQERAQVVEALKKRLEAAKSLAEATKSSSTSNIPDAVNIPPSSLNGQPPVVTLPAPRSDMLASHVTGARPKEQPGGTLQDYLDIRPRSNSIALPVTKPEDIIRANVAAASMAGVSSPNIATPSVAEATPHQGKLPEHYVLRPGIEKVDLSEIDFPEFCNGYSRMLKSMLDDPAELSARLDYFDTITQLADQHEWEDVSVFHQVACQEVKLNHEKWSNSFESLIRYKLKNAPPRNKRKVKSGKEKRHRVDGGTPDEICNNFNNKEQGCTYPGCNRTHACLYCYRKDGSINKGHRALDCVHRQKPKKQE